MNYTRRAKEIIGVEMDELRRVRDRLGIGFGDAVRLILDRLGRDGKVVVAGVGKSFHIGQKISASLASTGSTSVVLHPSQAAHGDLGILARQDVLLAISFSGESEELLAILPAIKRQGVKIVALTGKADSALGRHSDVVIPVAVSREACPFNLMPTASTTATLAIGDALAIVLLEARGFRKEDYARLHPGGSIGSALLLRVSDIMRRGDRLASVSVAGKVKDAILAMTRARSGCVGVVDGRGRVKGVFTDGDLRRLITGRCADVPGHPIRKVMTASPVTVADHALAVEVLKLFEEHRIDDLLVVDKTRRLVGLVDLQDLPRFKIL